ncbi:uncharacterized protein LOC111637823 [Centruroides sculpturatus]|uniref:uncharacterized protein LOC111637823 n=1 Tax=Centruroides sculpturatus TaxID=218467 RepID=UPI000C6EFA79|nr:uncharacterized protein LOC111637823 [Centruroides sculpturatus]
MAKVLTKSSQVFGPLVDKAARLCTVLVMAVYDPWGEPALNQLIEGQIDYSDATVGEFVSSEPEELLLTRVESLIEAGHIDAAIKLCKSCLIYCSSNVKDEKDLKHSLSSEIIYNSKTCAFVEKMLILLHEQGRHNEVLEMVCSKLYSGFKLI